MAGVCATNNKAQETNYYTPKWSDNIFISVGGGIHSVANDGFNRISPNFSISLGKYITPTWGIRGQVNGIWQSFMFTRNWLSRTQQELCWSEY